ncbi:hypothetical protein PsorP6_013678 [Peronosclerospora sorghi]|uniref:Uncharacterized protein n=1 Tax=Peronosclerospora sorghi TaxID=230839 RepID=A0ACC0VJI3_9STRA|nr:hypothetical protein PsorP6_013678 [Peronosclerospora sorghi]
MTTLDPNDAPGDWYAFFSLILGFVAFVVKRKEMAWGSLLLCLCSFIKMKSLDMNMSQVAMSFLFSTSALVSAYFDAVRHEMTMSSTQTLKTPTS